MRPGLSSPDPFATPERSSRTSRRQRITGLALLAALVCSGATSCTRTQIALSATAIGVAVAGTAVGVTYAVKHHNHTLQGCVFSDSSGLKLRSSDAKVYLLKGDAASLKAGESVSLHGSKVKRGNGDATGDRVFEVQKVNKVNGPCSAGGPTSTAQTP